MISTAVFAVIWRPWTGWTSNTIFCRAKARFFICISGMPPLSKLKEEGVLYFETEGKNKGCWVMRRSRSRRAWPKRERAESEDDQKGDRALQRHRRLRR